MKLLSQIRITIVLVTVAGCLLVACFNDTTKAETLPQPVEVAQEAVEEPEVVYEEQDVFTYPQEEEAAQEQVEAQAEYIEFVATAYCSCSSCCGKYAYNRPNGIVYGAAGRELVEGYSIAVDPSVIPYGTIVRTENGKEYRADDCGGAIKGNHIDIYFADHQKALKWGKQTIRINLGGV
nr:MAG TPA: lytic transglycosylase [Caudoviricetes sp.]